MIASIPQTLLSRLHTASDAKTAVADFVDHWLSQPASLAPWALWTLLILVRHHRRQQFVADTARLQLGADLQTLAAAGAMGHPPIAQQGLVPGLTDWEYYFHGRGCRLTQRITGEAIDVDFYDDTGDWFDDYFFVNYLKSLRVPAFWEQRAIELHPSMDTVVLAMQELTELGILQRHPEASVVRLGFDPDELLEAMDQLGERLSDEQSIRVGAAVGDWLLVADRAASGHISGRVHEHVTQLRQQRGDDLGRLFEEPFHPHLVLQAFNELRSPELSKFLQQALAGEPCGTSSAALHIIANMDSSEWGPAVYDLLQRVDPAGELPQPHIWLRSVEYLLRRNFPDQMRRRLAEAAAQSIGEAAVLALELAPEQALRLFRRALRSKIPHNRIVAAAALAVLDQEWSRRELMQVLTESNDQVATAECRAALMETHSQEAQQFVQKWEARNPHEPEQGEWITMQDMMLQNCSGTIRWEMAELHDRVLPLRTIVPPGLRVRWWPF